MDGVTILTFAFDVMHTLHLGIMQLIAKLVIWALSEADAWSVNGRAEVTHQVSSTQFRRELFNWYRSYVSQHPGRPLTQVADITHQLLGTRSHPEFKLKAADTWGVFLYLPTLIDDHVQSLGEKGPALRCAVNYMIQHVQVMNSHGALLPAWAIQALFDTMKVQNRCL